MSESIEAGRRVRLPTGAEPPIQVFINGTEQSEGRDYTRRGGEILFSRPLMKEKLSRGRWIAMGFCALVSMMRWAQRCARPT